MLSASLCASAEPSSAAGVWNSTTTAHIVSIQTWFNGNVMIQLDSYPAGIACQSRIFEIPEALFTEEVRQRMASRALTAYSLKEAVGIGYDNGACDSDGNIDVFSVG